MARGRRIPAASEYACGTWSPLWTGLIHITVFRNLRRSLDSLRFFVPLMTPLRPLTRGLTAVALAWCVVLVGRSRADDAPELSPADLPPLYVVDPTFTTDSSDGDAYWVDRFVGLPSCVDPDCLPDWPRWFGSATGLVMTRSLPTGTAFSMPGGVLGSTRDAGPSWPGGVDLRLGSWFGGRQRHGIEFIYWGVYNIGSTAWYDTPGTATSLNRSDLVNDVEINWLSSLRERPEFLPAQRRVNWIWLAGFRFFELQDVLSLAAPANSLEVATNNNLYGGQVGGKFDWAVARRLRFTAVPKFLLAGNAITDTSTVGGATNDTVHSTLGVFSWLGSVDTSVAWDVTDRWSLWMGYRVVGVGNIAQADDQWPAAIPPSAAELGGITAGSSSIVHGGFAGFEGRW